MGLDGISVNQLRIVPENNSAELNNPARFSLDSSHKVVDGLSQGQKIDPDRENEHENPQLNKQVVEVDSEEEQEEQEEIISYNLSDSNKYSLTIDEETNNILIIEKNTKNVVQKISAAELSNYVSFLSNSQGSMINRKF